MKTYFSVEIQSCVTLLTWEEVVLAIIHWFILFQIPLAWQETWTRLKRMAGNRYSIRTERHGTFGLHPQEPHFFHFDLFAHSLFTAWRAIHRHNHVIYSQSNSKRCSFRKRADTSAVGPWHWQSRLFPCKLGWRDVRVDGRRIRNFLGEKVRTVKKKIGRKLPLEIGWSAS